MLSRAASDVLHHCMIWRRSTLAVIVVLTALFSLVSPPLLSLWRWQVPIEPAIDLHDLAWEPGGGIVFTLLVGLVGWGLMRGKRQAWWLTVASVVLSLLSSILERSHWLSLGLSVIALLVLLWCAPLFPTRSDSRALLHGYLAFGLSAMCLLSTSLFLSLVPHGTRMVTLLSRREVFTGLHLLALLFLSYGLAALLRPVRGPRTAPECSERLRARMVLSCEGHLSLGHFTLSEDKHYFWSTTGCSFLAYVVHAGVALVLGEPIGPAAERKEFLRAFLHYCQCRDWSPALYQAGSATVQECCTLGWRAYKIGEEAILDLNTFTLQGKKGAAVRHMLARAKRANISLHCWQGVPIPEHLFTGMHHVSTAWEHDQQIVQQMRFSMGCFPEHWSPDLLTVVACDADGEVQAFLTWTPIYATRGWALDLIRRSKTAAPGTIESLIVEALEWARSHDTTHLSLGLAPLAGLGETERRPGSVLERGAAWLHQRGLLLGQYRSLRAFKAKFQPDWQERYLIVQERIALPKVVFALAWIQGYSWKTLLSQGVSCLHAFLRRRRGHFPPHAPDGLRTKGEAT